MEELKIDIRNWTNSLKERFKNKDLITIEELFADYENAIYEIESLKEKIEDLEQDIEDNYRPISKHEMYD